MLNSVIKLQVDELKQAKKNIYKFNSSNLQISTILNDGENIIKPNLPDHGIN